MATTAQVRKAEVTPYDYSNERLNALMEDETVFIVQGTYGRVPIIADTKEEALDRYVEKFKRRLKQDEDE